MAEQGLTSRTRWTKADWVELGIECLKRGGPALLTLEALCEAAGRTRGSFYHHFPAVDALLVEIALRWRRTETDDVGQVALSEVDPRQGLRALARRSAVMDHRLEIGVRALAADNADVSGLIREADETREQIICNLLRAAYGLSSTRAADIARLFHSLQLAAQIRMPEDVAAFSVGPARILTDWLEAEAKANSQIG